MESKPSQKLNIALAGNPNSGKTTLFNSLTGARQRVGNYPGITVERKEGTVLINGIHAEVLDLPGTYSLTAYSMEELVARRVLVEERPDVVVDVLDSTVLERSLYLAVQIMELGLPVVLALNMMDEAKARHIRIDSSKLSQLVGVPVVETIGRSGQGTQDLMREAAEFAARAKSTAAPLEISYGPDVEPAVRDMTSRITASRFMTALQPARWTAIKYVERDEEVMAKGKQADSTLHAELVAMVDLLEAHCMKTLGVQPDALVADYRYGYIASILRQGVVKHDELQSRIRLTDKIDQLLTHRVAGPLIMLGVLYAMFEATFFLGQYPMDWLEGGFAWLSETTSAILPEGPLASLVTSGIIDGVGGVLSFVPLIVIMFAMVTFLEDLGYMARMAYMLDRVFRIFGLHGCSVMPFVLSGGIAGGCAVPGIMAARTLKSPKEKLATIATAPFLTCGAKIPVFVLLVAAFFPAVEAQAMFAITLTAWVLALFVAKLLRSTIIRGDSTPFVMELPPYRLPTMRGILTHTFDRTWAYIKKAGTVILAVSILLWAAMTYPGLPEDQAAKFETLREEARATLTAAPTADGQEVVSLAQDEAPDQAASGILEQGDSEGDGQLDKRLQEIDNDEAQAALRHSVAGRLGVALEPLSRLAGIDWRTNIALVGGIAAKEVIVSTLGTAYSLGAVEAEDSASLSKRLALDAAWNPLAAASLILFVLVYAPCFVTVVTMAKESSWRWALFATVFNTVLAYGLAVTLYQVGGLLGLGG